MPPEPPFQPSSGGGNGPRSDVLVNKITGCVIAITKFYDKMAILE